MVRPSPLREKHIAGTFKLKFLKLDTNVGFSLHQEGTTVYIRLLQVSMTPKKPPDQPESRHHSAQTA